VRACHDTVANRTDEVKDLGARCTAH